MPVRIRRVRPLGGSFPHLAILAGLGLLLAACGGAPAAAPASPHADLSRDGSIAVPDVVQRNLGVTWSTAEYRVVQGVLRVPGRFESEPSARRTYPAPLSGRIDVLVRPFQAVAVGTPLYRLHAAGWLRLQQELTEAQAALRAADERLVAQREHVAALDAALAQWQARLETLERIGQELGGQAAERAEAAGRVAELRIGSAEARRALGEAARDAHGDDGQAAGGQARLRFDLLLAQAGQLTGLDPSVLADTGVGGRPRWSLIAAIEVCAVAPGVVEAEVVAPGTWIPEHAIVLTVTDPAGVRLQAAGLQADLHRLRDNLPSRIVAVDPANSLSLPARLLISPVADARDRSVVLIARPEASTPLPAWIRPGVTANLEIVVTGTAEEELAIPLAATIRDGLHTWIFRRDPRDAGRVLPVEADLGADDGRWVVVRSGLAEGDQVVTGGIYPLQLSRQGAAAATGHFHADGTFHAGGH